MRRLLPLLLILLAAAGCTPIVQTDVTRFHTLSPVPTAESFTIIPQGQQVGSLEFQRYAEMVAAELQRRGWRPLPASANANTVVHLDWGTGPARTELYQTPSMSVGTAWGPHSHWYGAGVGFPMDPFPYYETRTATYFPKTLHVEILDAQALRNGQRVVVFEGRAVTERGGRDINPLMPYLIQALFTNFPGASGQTVHINIPIPKGD